MPETAIHNVIIIGSGPAGYTAALYAARANLTPLVFAGLQPGGQLMITTDVENYPGFPDGIMGPEMMDLFRDQAIRFGAEVVYDLVTRVDVSQMPYTVYCGDKEFKAHALIVATGAEAKWLGLESEVTFGGYGVSACATCDGAFFRNLDVMVVGGGDTAMEEASYLTRHAKTVTLVHRRDEFRASKIMLDRVQANPKIEIMTNTVIEEITGEMEPHKKVTGVRLKNLVTQEVSEKPMDGVFIAIGHKPNSDLFKDILDLDENGYIIPDPRSSKTKVPGLFVCGDVADSTYRQAVTAAGSGCMAAIDAERYLETLDH